MIPIKGADPRIQDDDYDKPNRILYQCVNCGDDICLAKMRKYCDFCGTKKQRDEMKAENDALHTAKQSPA